MIDWGEFWKVISSMPVIMASIITAIGAIVNIILTTKYVESIKTKNQLIIEDKKGEITAEVNKRLEDFKQEYDREKVIADRKHQIAQEAYKGFFSSKITAYIQLANLKQEYEVSEQEFIPDNPIYLFNGVSANNIKLNNEELSKIMIKIQNHILMNKIYFSIELEEAFDIWYKKTAKKRATIEKMLNESNNKLIKPIHKTFAGSIINPAKVFKIDTVFKEADPERLKLFEQIDKDIIAIKSQYGI